MEDKQFNLLAEPWIRVVNNDLNDEEVSLTELFQNAHKYRRLAGETQAYDAAMYRMLLAIVETVFYRYRANGTEELLTPDTHTPEDVLKRWEDYHKKGQFGDVFQQYLEKYKGRFWLIHPSVPFYQIPDMTYGTNYQIKSVLGTLKESNNKETRHHFSMTEGKGLTQLGFAEAARCLIFYNAYSANVKPDKKAGVPGSPDPVSIGRMGAIGFIMAEGTNLFETLMLNLCALRDGEFLWGAPKPVWEMPVCDLQARKNEVPDNLQEAYTLQSRRLCWKLDREKQYAVSLQAMGGDYYPYDTDTTEQMTLWKQIKEKDSGELICLPKTHSAGYHLWREFSNMMTQSVRTPGLFRWLSVLCDKGLISEAATLSIRSTGMDYADQMRYVFGDCISDSMSLSMSLLTNLEAEWRQMVCAEVEKCSQVEEEIRRFTWKTTKILYGEDRSPDLFAKKLTAGFYSRIDGLFRQWLYTLNPAAEDMETKAEEWETSAYHAAWEEAQDYVSSMGNAAFRLKNLKKAGKPQPESVLEALSWYKVALRKIYPYKKTEEEAS